MDAIGLRPRIEEMADRIAARGYVVLAPNFFYRAGRAPVLPLPGPAPIPTTGPSFMQAAPADDGAADAGEHRARRRRLPGLSSPSEAPGPVAITGYCMGARVGWRIAAAYPDRVVALAASTAAASSLTRRTARTCPPAS